MNYLIDTNIISEVRKAARCDRNVAAWYATVMRDTVMAAHGGIARALMANFHILPEEEATHADILQGVVYVFDGGTLARYS